METKCTKLVLNSQMYGQPVQGPEKRGDMVTPPCPEDKPCGRILNNLQPVDMLFGTTGKEGVEKNPMCVDNSQ